MPAPARGQFGTDPRVHFDKVAGKFQYEDDETGQEYEWSETGQAWIPLVDEADWKAQQAAYSVAGVDENTPANAVLAREERRNAKKQKKEKEQGQAGNAKASSSSSSSKPLQPGAPKKTAVWVTNLPPHTTPELLASVFSKAGVLLIGDDGEPRIKLYYDDNGRFKGDALVLYFKEGSVDLAITLLDDTELEMGAGYGNMRVRVAEYDKTQAPTGEKKVQPGEAKAEGGGEDKKRKPPTAEEKARMSKRIKRMQDKLTWHSDDESDDDGGAAPPPGENRNNRVVVLKGMFTLEDLEKEPGLLLELKEDVRDEAETLGQVTSVVLYDKEHDGVMTIKFKDPVSAQACVLKMNNRYFDGRQIYAGLYTGRERYKRSGANADIDAGEEDKERLDKFAAWLVEGDHEGTEA